MKIHHGHFRAQFQATTPKTSICFRSSNRLRTAKSIWKCNQITKNYPKSDFTVNFPLHHGTTRNLHPMFFISIIQAYPNLVVLQCKQDPLAKYPGDHRKRSHPSRCDIQSPRIFQWPGGIWLVAVGGFQASTPIWSHQLGHFPGWLVRYYIRDWWYYTVMLSNHPSEKNIWLIRSLYYISRYFIVGKKNDPPGNDHISHPNLKAFFWVDDFPFRVWWKMWSFVPLDHFTTQGDVSLTNSWAFFRCIKHILNSGKGIPF